MRPSLFAGSSWKWLLAFLLPILLYLYTVQAVLTSHIQTVVTNDPQTSLTRALAAARLSLAQRSGQVEDQAAVLAQNDHLQKRLALLEEDPTTLHKWRSKIAELADHPLFIVTDDKGGVIFAQPTIGTPSPTPTPTPSSHKKHEHKAPAPLFNISGWSGISDALKGNSVSGLFDFQGQLYQTSAVPVYSDKKFVGVLMAGTPWSWDSLAALKTDIQDDLALFAEDKMPFSTLSPAEDRVLQGSLASSGPITLDSQGFLKGQVPILGLDQKPAAVLEVLQPVKETVTVSGLPGRLLERWGLVFLFLGLALVLWLLWDKARALAQMLSAVEKLPEGKAKAPLPIGRQDEWGVLARALEKMRWAQVEKDRLSLVLGKVVSPKSTQQILSAQDYFALKGEKRECCILHLQFKGFNALAANLAPSVLVESLNQYFSLVNDVVFQYEGLMDKFVGDTAIAVWGAPLSQADKEWRSVQACLEIQEKMKEFNVERIRKDLPPFTLGAGLHTGTVVSGNLGSERFWDYSVIGEPLHVAARLCDIAAPGQTVVSADVYEKVQHQVQVRSLDPIAIKDSRQPLATYEILKTLPH